ncbi:peptidylprolyl isomerase [Virgibacillus sp. NKC19-16]|uniref:peptidylprolyl isomerase n=1 Tax=Virgibacillus salidurans TaxID=2831673 RepID=UPI001F355586|nr:peptidylprolyl isomerase [Virgibacillus sp. NKC19-16]UJL47566.1 peptidylprolyl isomerase [Virgibacillus sp. NKC19-16]
MKKLAMAVTLTAGVLTLAACSDSGEETVVESDAGNITQDEFYQELKDRHGEAMLQELMTVQVLENNYEVDEAAVDEEVQAAKDQLGEQFEMALQQQGIPDEEAYREVVRISMLQQQALTEDVEIPEEEIQAEYDRRNTEIDAQHILVEDEETANEVKEQLDDGADFAELASEYSTDGTAEDGGNLGYFSVGDMVPPFEDAAYSMEEGEISDPVATQHGFHIIKVNDKREAEESIGEYEDVKDSIRDELALEQIDPAASQQKMNQLMQDANIEVQLEEFEGLFAPPEEAQQNEQESGDTESENGSDSESEGDSNSESGDTESEEGSEDSETEENSDENAEG